MTANFIPSSLQMMFVSGESGEPSAETAGIIEEIVHQQVVEIVSVFWVHVADVQAD
jgi:hypothetical protein